jgi:tRNA(fMet)-specific endonuclease VapC
MSLYVFDTGMLTLLQHQHSVVCTRAAQHPPTELAITVITVEEQLSGWYRRLRKARTPKEIAIAYQRLTESVTALAKVQVLTFSETAVYRYHHLLTLKLNVRKMDLRIAAIVLEHQAILISRNLRDFQRVSELQLEDWSK